MALGVILGTCAQRKGAILSMTFESIELNEKEKRVYFYPGIEKCVRRKAHDIPLSDYLGPFVWIGKILFRNHLAKTPDIESFWLGLNGTPGGKSAFTDWVKYASEQLCGKKLTPASFRRMFMTQVMKSNILNDDQINDLALLQNTSVAVIGDYYNRQNASEENRALNTQIIEGLGLFNGKVQQQQEEEDAAVTEERAKKKANLGMVNNKVNRITQTICSFKNYFWKKDYRPSVEFNSKYYEVNPIEWDFEISDSDSELDSEVDYHSGSDSDSDLEKEEKDFTKEATQLCQPFIVQLEDCSV